MESIANKVRRFIADERGLETVEYAIIAGLITGATITTIAGVALLVSTRLGKLERNLRGEP